MKKRTLSFILISVVLLAILLVQTIQIKSLKADNLELKQGIIDYRVELIPFETTDYFISHNLGIIDDKELLFSYKDLLGEEYAIFFYNEDCRASQQVSKEIHRMLLNQIELPMEIYFINMQLNKNFAADESSIIDTNNVNKENFAVFVTPTFLTFRQDTYSFQSGFSEIMETLKGEVYEANN